MWICPKCGTKVDGSFEVCWSCGTTQEGVEDPSFVTADDAGPIEDPVLDDQTEWNDGLDDFAGSPLPDVVPCYMASNTIEAKFVADRLTELGIPALADSHDINLTLGGFQPGLWGYGPCVRVRPEDLPKAQAWLRTYDENRKSRQTEASE